MAFQEEEEITAMIDGPHKDKQQCGGTLKKKKKKGTQEVTSECQERSQESRFGIKSIKFGKGNLKKITVLASEY